MFDQHLHSRFSMDCQTEPEDNVRAALDRGLDGLTFTEHFDLHPFERGECIYDHAAYRGAIEDLQREHRGRLQIGLGIEVGYFAGGLPKIAAFLSDKAFDLVILSFHYVDDRPLHLREGWDGLDVATATRRYLAGVADGLAACRQLLGGRGPFQVLGHLDLVKRYSHRMFGSVAVDACGDQIDRVLTLCLESGIVPEINTSTLRQGLTEPMPGAAIVQRYAELGGVAMSLGSDAHRAADIGADFDRASAMLSAAGLDEAAFHAGELVRRPVRHAGSASQPAAAAPALPESPS